MAKTIKRVGIIFFVLVVSLLVAIGSVFAVNVTSNYGNDICVDSENMQLSGTYLDETVVEADNGVTPPDTSTPDFKLEGTNTDKVTVWNNAVTKSINDKVNVIVKLINNWDVSSTSDHSFGTGTGFRDGRIWIPSGANVTLDLNGKTINKGCEKVILNGHVIMVSGTFTLVDSVYKADVALSTARANSDNLKNLPYGKITGGYCTGGANGAGIRMQKIASDAPVLNMYGGIITGNHAESQGGGIGVVNANNNYSINIYNGIICDNIADSEGGGIYAGQSDNLVIKGGIFANNSTNTNGGGGVRVGGNYNTFEMINTLVINNRSKGNGGGVSISSQNKYFTISKCEIIGNENGDEMNGGGVYISANSIATIENCIIKNNFSQNAGGGITMQENAILTMKGCKILNNTANQYAGGVGIAVYANVTLQNTIIDGNEAINDYGGGFLANSYAKNISLSNVTITNNKAETYGGGFVVHADSVVQISQSNISSNTTNTSNAGGAHVSTRSFWSISETTISNNSSRDALGGGLYCNDGSHTTITKSNIVNNTSGRSGAGIYANLNTMISISETEINGNVALSESVDGGGGGIYMNSNATVRLDNSSVVKNNEAVKNTGGIYMQLKANLMLDSTIRIYDNKIKDADIISDIYLTNGRKLNIDGLVGIEGDKKIHVKLADDYDKFAPFTSEFAYNNLSVDPNSIFACSGDSSKIAVLKDGEVIFDDADKSIYDFIYLENGVRKNYRDNEKLYGYNDSAITNKVLGKIAPETTVDTFVAELKFDTTKLQIFNKDILVYDKGNKLVDGVIGSGWKMVYDGADIYLSVLGDVTGDGRIDATDITYLRRIANGEIDKATLNPAILLAAMVDNRGKITSVDAEILRAICKYETVINKYF